MTNNKQEEKAKPDKYRDALLAVLQSTTGAEIPAELMDKPELIAEMLADRFKHLSDADGTVAGLMELGAELVARGDRWKQLAGRAHDTLTGEQTNKWRDATELAEKIIKDSSYEEYDVSQFAEVEVDHPNLQDFEYLVMAAKEADALNPAGVYRERFAKADTFTASEKMAERVKASFAQSVRESKTLSPIIPGIR